ncbi:DUF4198 domain-containing protein [Actibacterium sp. D379-3]
MRLPVLLSTLATMLFAVSATAHEFWLSPEQYQVAPDQPIRADIRVGQNFAGAAYAYIPDRTARFELVMGDTVMQVPGRMGDRPALAMAAPQSGLAILVHETTDTSLTYTEWDKFASFVAHKAFPGLPAAHMDRHLPQTGFSESYRRYAKALVAVGDGAGQDRNMGLETEIIALANPYTDALAGGLPVRVLYQRAPRVGAQLEVFARAPDGTVTTARLTTDDQGQVTVPVQPGHEYLLDAVVLRDTGNDDPAAGPVWRSLWAALTFAIPG